jgi:hypothetical protein
MGNCRQRGSRPRGQRGNALPSRRQTAAHEHGHPVIVARVGVEDAWSSTARELKRWLGWAARLVRNGDRDGDLLPASVLAEPDSCAEEEPGSQPPGLNVVDTTRPRAGRRFLPSHELALHADAERACASLPGAGRGLLVIREMVGPIGIPDLTAVVGPPELLRARLALPVPPLLNEVDAAIAAAASPSAARTVQAIAAKLGWPSTTIERRLPGLLRSGALLRSGRESYIRPPDLVNVGRIYAVEAKVRDAAAALQQVRTYTVWADGYVLVMSSLTDRVRARVGGEVAADRGGLMIAGKWVSRPVVHRLPAPRRLWASEHVVAAVAGSLPALPAAVDR